MVNPTSRFYTQYITSHGSATEETSQSKLKYYTTFEPQSIEDLLIKVKEFIKRESEFIEPGTDHFIAETEKEETYFLASEEVAKIIFNFFHKDGPAFAYFNLQMEAYKAAFEWSVTKMLESESDRSTTFYKKQIEELTGQLETQKKIFMDLKDHSRITGIFTKPSYCTLNFLKRFVENFGKISENVVDKVFYNLEVEATSILRKNDVVRADELEKLKEQAKPIIEKLKIVLPHDKILSKRLTDDHSIQLVNFMRNAGNIEKCQNGSNCVERLLAFLINQLPEDPISTLKDYIVLRQKESDDFLEKIIHIGFCWKEITDDKTLVRHFTVAE